MEHLLQFIKYKGITIFNFEKKIGVRSTIDKAIKQKTNLRGDILSKIVEVFPEINPYWLLTGKGEMLLESKDSSNKPSTNIATNVETATKREIHLSEEVITLLKEKISDLEKKIETLSNTSSTIEILTRIEDKLDTSLETNKTLFSEIEEYFELMKLKENLEKAKNIETHHESKK